MIWYQGESDAGPARAATYERAFETLVKNWREKWGQGDFPFIYTQISSYASVPSENWGGVRDAQRRALSLANVAMAVTLDVGLVDKVHPPDKQTVAARLAAGARAVAYQKSNVEYSGPIFRQATTEGKSIRAWFLHADGLTSRGPVLGFEVAGNDHHFHSAEAHIEGATVVASSSDVPAPKYVRYAWPNFPSATLYNRAGFPTSTFTSEDRLDVFAANR